MNELSSSAIVTSSRRSMSRCHVTDARHVQRLVQTLELTTMNAPVRSTVRGRGT